MTCMLLRELAGKLNRERPLSPPELVICNEQRQRLRALGYLGCGAIRTVPPPYPVLDGVGGVHDHRDGTIFPADNGKSFPTVKRTRVEREYPKPANLFFTTSYTGKTIGTRVAVNTEWVLIDLDEPARRGPRGGQR